MWNAYIRGLLQSWKRVAQVGNQTTAGVSAPSSPNRLWMSPFTFANAGIIVGLHIKVHTTNAVVHGKFVVASDSAGVPGTVLYTSPAGLSLNTSQVDMTGLAISVVSGTNHLGIVTNGGGYPSFDGNYTGHMERAESFTYSSPPGTVPTLASNDAGQQLAIWADVQYDS